MKKALSITLSVFLLLVLTVLPVSAYETDIMKIDIPEIFSVLTENEVEGSSISQWTDADDNSNIGITVTENTGFSYAELSDVEKATAHTTIITQMKKDVGDLLESYSIDYEITDSVCNNVEINGTKGLEVLYDSVYSYEDGSTLEAKNYIYLFSSANNIITISATINSEDKLHLVDEMMNSFEFKEEVYTVSDDGAIDTYFVVKYTVVGAAAGGAAGLILAMMKKKKKKTEQAYVTVSHNETDKGE